MTDTARGRTQDAGSELPKLPFITRTGCNRANRGKPRRGAGQPLDGFFFTPVSDLVTRTQDSMVHMEWRSFWEFSEGNTCPEPSLTIWQVTLEAVVTVGAANGGEGKFSKRHFTLFP